jgi:ribosome-binding protein aMBF1 (putative translation factor)
MSMCEVCGRADEEEERAISGISMAILHICDACQADRQTGGTAAVGEEED